MFEIDIQKDFAAAHALRGYDGNCSEVHGHNWTVQVFVKTETLDSIGIAVDFRRLKNKLSDILDNLDHSFLNDITPFTEINPTSENLAKYIYEQLSSQINDDSVRVDRVRVCESPGAGATYSCS